MVLLVLGSLISTGALLTDWTPLVALRVALLRLLEVE
jgi:hypothetical protein